MRLRSSPLQIEEGSKAAAADGLLAGDEIISINDMDLSGFRQEAICLVKGSHRTLKLIVKRKNDLACRPHSWHSTKFTESPLETTSSQLSSANVCTSWHSRYHSSSSSHDLPNSWDQANLQRTSDHFSSQGSMDSLDHYSQAYQYGRLSSARSSNSIDHLGNQSKHDSAYGSFSTSSSTPDHTFSKNDAASTENMLYKVGHWDTVKHGDSKQSHFPNENKVEDKWEYSPSPVPYESNRNPRPEDHSDAKLSGCGRSNFGPVWHVPDKKKASYSPPPPTPPLRSDSFAVTKGHEKTHGPVHSDSTSTQHFTVPSKSQPKGEWSKEASDYQQKLIRLNDRGSAEARRMNNYRSDTNLDRGSSSSDRYNNNVSNTNRLQSSLSSTDVRFAQPAYGYHHQRQHSDESTFFPHARVSNSPNLQQDVTFYSGTKELPTNHLCNPPQVRLPGPFPSTNTAAEQKAENTGPSRYYCVTAKQPIQGIAQPTHFKAEIRKAGASDDVPSASSEKSAMTTVIETPTCYLPQQHDKSSQESCEKTDYRKLEGGGSRSVAVEEFKKSKSIERTSARSDKQSTVAVEQRAHQKDLSCDEESSKISPQSTPMLHSLAQEGKSWPEGCPATGRDRHPSVDALMSKQPRRNDRYATALRNEIQTRRARLQKSKSTAALNEPCEAEEHTGNWKPDFIENFISSDHSFTSTYKDHLKEAQARVLKATSFKRRDLEPGPSDHPSMSPEYRIHSQSFSTLAFPSEDASELSEPTQVKVNLSGSGSQQVLRIGGRKRFTTEQKLRSYSEPEKMHEVGISEDCHRCPNTSEEVLGSFADRWKFFEETSKSTHQKPAHKPTPASVREELARKSHGNDGGESWRERRARAASLGSENILDPQERTRDRIYYGGHQAVAKSAKPEQSRRLGTFAEYQASWKEQRKLLETKSSGRYHSADNILDAGLEEHEKPQYRHERSRSSPSTDYYAQDDSAGARRRRRAEDGREEQQDALAENGSPEAGSSPLRHIEIGHVTDSAGERGDDFDQNLGHRRKSSSRPSETREPLVPAQESRARSGTLPSDYRYSAEIKDCSLPSFIHSEPHAVNENRSCHQGRGEDSQQIDPAVSNKKRRPPPQRPPPPKLDSNIKYKCPDGLASSPGTFLDSLLTVPSKPAPSCSPSAADAVGLSITRSPAERVSARLQEPRQTSSSENERQHLEKTHLSSEPALPLKYRFLQKSGMETSRSPSPQFAPQKLTDKPPVSVQDENPARIERVIGKNTTVKMVPIKIVHSESHAEKENRQNLLSNIEPPVLPSGLEKDQIKTLSTSEQSYSRFCAYTRQDPEYEVENQTRTADSQRANSPESILKDSDISNLSINYTKAKEKTFEDLKSEELAREIVGKDKSLADILDPNVKLKTAMDLMVGIFPKDDHLLEDAQQRRKFLAKIPSPKLTEEKKEEQSMPSAVSLTTSSAYYSTSAPKAELLIKMKDMQQQQQQQQAEEDSEEELDCDLSEKKQELIDSISRKLQVLREARESLLEDIQANNVLGDEVEAIVKDVCKANEFDKFRMFIGDLDKVVNLLLSLSGRLARVENALNNLDGSASPEERRTLEEKQKLLTRQHEDAKELKENLDRRERIVFDILASYLSEESLADYEHFVKMKPALIIEQRELEDKIKLGEEQLKCLTDSLPLDRTK
ncbi:protein Shroom2 isoform X2 [Rhinatrema bivittatum]|uniref:protein Shroom2 isoform X2 n=1 Tax=Rhinatrema bivittatum TaxID=194408 RepID=UPI00112BC3EE|nr:protein Shroom2 isoform X2 [Rhinatrema bivittatum]